MRWKTTRRPAEKTIAERLRRASKFYVFLWSIREELFDDAFQDELIAAYEPRGQEPCPPAMLAMVNLLQRFDGVSDADAVDEAENDQRWRLVLGTLDEDRAPFGQGSLVRFRAKAIRHDLDKKLVARTIELAKRTEMYSWKRLKVVLDSSPLEGAGRVDDTWNLIGVLVRRERDGELGTNRNELSVVVTVGVASARAAVKALRASSAALRPFG